MGVKNKSKQNAKVNKPQTTPAVEVKSSNESTQLVITNIRQKTDVDELIKFIKVQSNAQFDEIEFAHGPYAVIKASKENAAKILSCDKKKFGQADLHVASVSSGSLFLGNPKVKPEDFEPKKQVRVLGKFNADEILEMVPNALRVFKSNNSLVFEMKTLEESKNLFLKLFKLKNINRNFFKLYYQDPKSENPDSAIKEGTANRVMIFNAPLECVENDIKELVPDAIQVIKNIGSVGSFFVEFADNQQCKAGLKVLQEASLKNRSLRAEFFNNDFTIKFNVKPTLKDPVKMKEFFPKSTLVKAVPSNKGPTFVVHFVKKEDWIDAMEVVKKGNVGNYHVWTVVTKRDAIASKVIKPKAAVQIKGKKAKKESSDEEEDDEEDAQMAQKLNSKKRSRTEEDDDDSEDDDSEDDDDESGDEISLEGESDDDDEEDDDDDDEDDDEEEDEDESEAEEPSPAKKSQEKSTKPTIGAKRNLNASKKNFKKMRRN